MIKLSNISFKYHDSDRPTLTDLNFQLIPGEFITLAGLNGSGKSTLAKLLNGEIMPNKGSVEIDGLFSTNANDILSIRKKVGHVFQNPDSQIIFSTVEEELVFGATNIGLSKNQISTRINQVLNKVNASHLINEKIFNLSAGQKQLITISSVMIMDPTYYICDESTSMLDNDNKENIFSLLFELKKMYKGILFITNDLDDLSMTDRQLILNDGKLSG